MLQCSNLGCEKMFNSSSLPLNAALQQKHLLVCSDCAEGRQGF
jgi:hypothetical protein